MDINYGNRAWMNSFTDFMVYQLAAIVYVYDTLEYFYK